MDTPLPRGFSLESLEPRLLMDAQLGLPEQQPIGPDLWADVCIEWLGEDGAMAGSRGIADLSISNLGNALAKGSYSVIIYAVASEDAILPDGDDGMYRIGSYSGRVNLDAEEADYLTLSVKLPGDIPSGSYDIRVVLSTSIRELDADNTNDCDSVDVGWCGPDLTVSQDDFSRYRVRPGDKFKIFTTLGNCGEGRLRGQVKLQAFIEVPSGECDADGNELPPRRIPIGQETVRVSLGDGSEETEREDRTEYEIDAAIPSDLPTGEYAVVVRAMWVGHPQEEMSDNESYSNFNLEVLQPDLSVLGTELLTPVLNPGGDLRLLVGIGDCQGLFDGRVNVTISLQSMDCEYDDSGALIRGTQVQAAQATISLSLNGECSEEWVELSAALPADLPQGEYWVTVRVVPVTDVGENLEDNEHTVCDPLLVEVQQPPVSEPEEPFADPEEPVDESEPVDDVEPVYEPEPVNDTEPVDEPEPVSDPEPVGDPEPVVVVTPGSDPKLPGGEPIAVVLPWRPDGDVTIFPWIGSDMPIFVLIRVDAPRLLPIRTGDCTGAGEFFPAVLPTDLELGVLTTCDKLPGVSGTFEPGSLWPELSFAYCSSSALDTLCGSQTPIIAAGQGGTITQPAQPNHTASRTIVMNSAGEQETEPAPATTSDDADQQDQEPIAAAAPAPKLPALTRGRLALPTPEFDLLASSPRISAVVASATPTTIDALLLTRLANQQAPSASADILDELLTPVLK